MKLKIGFFALFIMCALAVSIVGYLYAQDSGDSVETGQEGDGDEVIPSDDELVALLTTAPNPNAVVGPLIQTKWGQGQPYRSLLPGRSRPGCFGVAVAQLMAFHRHPVRGTGRSEVYTTRHGVNVPLVNFERFTFDWNNTLNSYRSDGRNSTEQQRRAIAEIYYHVCVGLRMNFGFDGAGGGVSIITDALVNHFGYDRSIQAHNRSYYDDAIWMAMIRAQLDAGLPIFYYGVNRSDTARGSNHAFIIDGYDSTGRVHVNWGWSGQHDGWYSIDALNPGNRNYSSNQRMRINIKPDHGSIGSNEMSLLTFTANKTTVTQNEIFTVSTRIRSAGFFPGGERAVALVDNSIQGIDGRIVEVMGAGNYNALNPGSSRNSNINCFISSSVNPGQYRLQAVTRMAGEEWKLINVSSFREGVTGFIPLAVTAERGSPGGGYGLALRAFTASTTAVSVNERFTVNINVRNMGFERFPGGQAGAVLTDSNNNIVAVIGTRNIGERSLTGSSGNQLINCTVPNTVRPGRYQLRIVIRPTGEEQWRIASWSYDGSPVSIDFTVR